MVQFAQFPRQQFRLIIAPLSKSLGVKGHRYERISRYRVGGEIFAEQFRQRSGDSSQVLVFQFVDGLTYRAIESKRRADAIDVGLPANAGRAQDTGRL